MNLGYHRQHTLFSCDPPLYKQSFPKRSIQLITLQNLLYVFVVINVLKFMLQVQGMEFSETNVTTTPTIKLFFLRQLPTINLCYMYKELSLEFYSFHLITRMQMIFFLKHCNKLLTGKNH
ncbi:hypothetical protein BRARA_F01042 [Brassica rapa]|uniref:Uncharacterized protein n=1 Tax=Brassica campestris TaxID=3711 RepID=A0A397Z5X3_BRACM|nr:hypothetical protein BRARA_F01042 [Brassica rapa]